MTGPLADPFRRDLADRLSSRGDLTTFLMRLAADVGADAYMLVSVQHDQDRSVARIVASNWIHDAIELAGPHVIAALAESPGTAAPGGRGAGLRIAEAPELPIGGDEAKLLDVLGHREIFTLKLSVGRQRFFLLLSSAEPGAILRETLTAAQIRCCYALSQIPAMLGAAAIQDPLSERERECLSWVSEGKTTDEVGLILGVSSNTVNSYITHAIQKLSADNRAMAIATAIRSGII